MLFARSSKTMKSTILTLALVIHSFGIVYSQLPPEATDVCPLKIGEYIPKSKVITVSEIATNSEKLFKQKKTILLFYRGGWCPYCNRHLSAIGEIEEEITQLGYQIVAVSPDSPAKLQETLDKNKLGYTLLTDLTGEFSETLGIAFKAPANYSGTLAHYSNNTNPGFLPVPSVFIVDQNGMILFSYVCPNYQARMSASLLTAVLKGL